jgi:isopentenyl-diphosphate delta-isomerase
MTDTTNQRKIEHLDIICNDPQVDRRKHYFDDYRLRHRALPEINLADIDTSVEFLGKTLRMPLLISSMTGGDHDRVRTVNRNLAAAAERTGVAMGVGSQRVMFTNPAARDSFALRELAPTAPLFANLGAVQLNCGFGAEECQAAIDVLGADGIFLHLNPLQEAIQPEGDTNFGGLAARIGEVAQALSKPVILKEVGAGIAAADVELVKDKGVAAIDVAGTGGTSWSRIEHHRRGNDSTNLGLLFQDWGIPTPQAVQQLSREGVGLPLIASGGIRHGLDMAKAMVLGASLCGMASPFLAAAHESPEAVISVIERLERELRTAMFVLGVKNCAEVIGNTDLLLES